MLKLFVEPCIGIDRSFDADNISISMDREGPPRRVFMKSPVNAVKKSLYASIADWSNFHLI